MAPNPRPLDATDFRLAVDSHARDWGVTDAVLYELCRNHPTHGELSAANAKSLLIGRTFATGVERHIKSSGSQGSSIGQLAEHLHTNSKRVDGIISRLRKLKEPLNLQSLSVVVSEHGKFCKLLVQISRNGNVPASFASKYLHFHCPVVPIYDRWAFDQAWRRRRREGLRAIDMPDDAHEGYYWYSLCFWQHYSELRAHSYGSHGGVLLVMASWRQHSLTSVRQLLLAVGADAGIMVARLSRQGLGTPLGTGRYRPGMSRAAQAAGGPGEACGNLSMGSGGFGWGRSISR